MLNIRTDLAIEARELATGSESDVISGVSAEERTEGGFTVSTVRVLNDAGEKALGKPVGEYVTMELGRLIKKEEDAFNVGVTILSEKIRDIMHLSKNGSVLVACLGNSGITPDALGHWTGENIMVTRHLVEKEPEHFGFLRPVSLFRAGVLGTTGAESGELIRAVTDKLKPELVVVIDALASRRISRVCTTVQLSDTGIVPGSGVGNSRSEISERTLGVPVISIGVPTVVDAVTLAYDILSDSGMEIPDETLRGSENNMIVTPREIDSQVRDLGKLIGYSLNLAFHDAVSIDDITMFLS